MFFWPTTPPTSLTPDIFLTIYRWINKLHAIVLREGSHQAGSNEAWGGCLFTLYLRLGKYLATQPRTILLLLPHPGPLKTLYSAHVARCSKHPKYPVTWIQLLALLILAFPLTSMGHCPKHHMLGTWDHLLNPNSNPLFPQVIRMPCLRKLQCGCSTNWMSSWMRTLYLPCWQRNTSSSSSWWWSRPCTL